MRLRTTVGTGLGAVALALALAAPAAAATGTFSYVYDSPAGPRIGVLHDPPSRQCVTLPEAAAPWTPPAHTPRNRTDATAVVFTGPDCTGDHFSMRPHTGYGTERLKVRSVVFS
ncbi:hypothetical protein GCM10009801_36450 [Streptomyces albiaxialis]|uniref:Uncharacterized protein n=1 Tax=Streptomyces albiaxialis TaxID=329523 RepID=A0ABN2W2B1_9ACTN